jgi:hypothetical protein
MTKDLWRGTVRHVTMRAEHEGKAWRSVAYFSLDGQPARLVCDDLPPYSRTPLPAPFELGDTMIVSGQLNAQEGRLEVSVAHLTRQGRTIDASYANQIFSFGCLLALPAAILLVSILSDRKNDDFGRLVGAIVFSVLAIAILWFIASGYRRIKARRRVEETAFGA